MIGTLLGARYELIEKIGEGGMAEVYKAKCHLLNRYVAVKILKKEFVNNKDFVNKFQTEAKAAGSLSDNHIVNIYDVGNQDDINYIVMEYVKGKTLKELIKEEGRIEYLKSIDIAIEIAEALDCAHKNNIVHRDIKPHNILITENEKVKVTDFGIARVSNFSTITNTARVVGSAHYFSPEQARGSFVDCRSDLYSLGIIMYEMVTGKVPYDADSPVGVALKHIEGSVVPPIKVNPSIPESLNNLILKCIDKEPIKRYQSAQELINELNNLKNNKNIDIKFNNYDDDYTRVMEPIDVNTNNYNEYENFEDGDEYEEDDYNYEKDNNNTRLKKTRRKKQTKDKKKIAIIAVSILIVVSVVGIIANVFATKKFGNKNVDIPDIIGLDKNQAKRMVEDKGLKFMILSSEESDKPKNEVIYCYPKPGTNVKSDSEIQVKISAGNKNNEVPDLVDMNINLAKQKIIDSGFSIGEIRYTSSENVQKGNVVEQFPTQGKKYKAGYKIDLVVSKSSQDDLIQVPNLYNKTIDEAKSILESLNLKLGSKVEIKTGDKEKDGKIYNQSVPPNKKVEEGTNVSVSYFKYSKEMSGKP
ncbi:Stk1 family PASTA domain-containing Ser/Thr kinase [Haloimpatiens sp. FM7330]|uniref:Stk1 family PASTA domain-containing Ser/Thr kinase n=1 Tax=Haloimpatiens sp. FM7330 TaxID=3298610 RepID=UPI00363CD97F